MLDTYETIEMLGLTETDDDLPIPDDVTLRDEIMHETFECLFAGLQRTGLAREIEPLAHGFAALFHRRRDAMSDALTKHTDALRGLIRANDGSEILDVQITEGQRKAERLSDISAALDLMAETAAQCYEVQTGKAFIPASGGRSKRTAHLTGAVFEANAWLETHEREQAKQFEIAGTPLAIAGNREWTNHAQIWETLDKIKERFKESYATDLILYHKADKFGVDAIAAAWARSRKVAQVTFQPNWRAFGKAAGFKAIDQMLSTPKPLGGVAIFGTNGIALNLATKAEAKGIKAMRIEEKAPKAT